MSSVSASRHPTRRRRWGDDSGATALEFALIVPVMITLLIGAFQTAWVMHCAASVRYSLETQARSLLLNPNMTADALKSAMVSQLTGLVDTSSLKVTIVTDNSVAGAPVLRASSEYEPTLAIPFVSTYHLDLKATTVVPTP